MAIEYIILLHVNLGCYASIFIREPHDVCIGENGNAFFQCLIAGATSTPFWKINGRTYSSTRLPIKHVFNGTGLVVQNTDLSMDNSTYSCLYYVTTSEGLVLQESAQALLTVHPSNTGNYVIT